jgi:hypothetical protein
MVKIKPNPLTEIDSITLIRVAFKCADIIVETDTLLHLASTKEAKYIKREMKLAVQNFTTTAEDLSSQLLGNIYKADEKLSLSLSQGIRDFTEQIWIKDEETTSLALVYSMALSIVHDYRDLSYSDARTTKLYNAAYKLATSVPVAFPWLLQITDKHGNGIAALVDTFDLLGKKIMYGHHKVKKGEAFYLFTNGKCSVQKIKGVTKTHVLCTKGQIKFGDFRENPDSKSNIKYVAYL